MPEGGRGWWCRSAATRHPAGHCQAIRDVNGGGPHAKANAVADGRMTGFIHERDVAQAACRNINDPACSGFGPPDVMGYHTAAEIPNYWAYARDFAPRPPVLLPTNPPTDSPSIPAWFHGRAPSLGCTTPPP